VAGGDAVGGFLYSTASPPGLVGRAISEEVVGVVEAAGGLVFGYD